MIIKAITFIIAIILFKFLYNLYYFFCVRFYLKKYDEYIQSSINDAVEERVDNKGNWFISDNRQKIVEILEKANVKDAKFTHVEELGYGNAQSMHLSVFANLSIIRSDVSPIVYSKIREAKQVYRGRMKDSFNPFFWIDFIFYFPKALFGYFDISGDKTIVKVFQLLWWLFGLASAVISILFNDSFTNWVKLIIK